jgi:hypothetical protein
MVNIAITIGKHRNEEMQERKRKFEGRKQCSQGKFQKTHQPFFSGQRTQQSAHSTQR